MKTLDAEPAPPESGATPAETVDAEQAVNARVLAQGLSRAVETRATVTTRPAALSPAELRRDREARVWLALVQSRRRARIRSATRQVFRTPVDAEAAVAREMAAAAPRLEALDAGFDSMPGLWPARNTLFRDPSGTAKDDLGEPGVLPRVIHPYSDVETRTTYAADADGRPQRIPADRLDDWLDRQHEQRVHQWLTARGVSNPSTAARVAAALRTGKEDAVLDWLGGRGIERAKYEGIRPWLDRGVVHLDGRTAAGRPEAGSREGTDLPFASPRAQLPGEPATGLRGKVLPYPTRDYGRRPQAQRLHTCVACSYGKYDRHERNFDLCKDCHRIIGSIPTDMFRRMRQQLEDRGLVEKHAESLAPARGFAEVAQALQRRWRAEHLVFGDSTGERFVLYPESDRLTRRTLVAGPDGRPGTLRASDVTEADIRPIRGRYPYRPRHEPVDLADALGAGLARTEDELMLAGARGSRTEESQFEVEGDSGREGWGTAAALSDFGDQRPIEVQKGSGLSKDEIFALSEQVERSGGGARGGRRETNLSRARGGDEGRRGPRRFTHRTGRTTPPARSLSTSLAPRGWRRPADMRHLRGHADPLFFAGPTGETLTRHALAGTLTTLQRDEARTALVQRDWSEAIHDDKAWEARRIRAGISPHWRKHSDRSGPLPAITPPVFIRGYAGPTGVDEALGRHEHSQFLATHRERIDNWLSSVHDQRVGEWLTSQGLSDPLDAWSLGYALRELPEEAVDHWLAERGIPKSRLDEVRDSLDEASPAAFHRTAPPLNPSPREIGDLTPEAPIRDRLTPIAAAMAAEAENWRVHGSPLTPAQAEAAIAEYRSATKVTEAPDLPLTSGTVAVQRGDAEAPLDFANARARLQEARETFDTRLKTVFADPDAFKRLFARVTPATRRQILDTMRTAPAALEGKFGGAARLTGAPGEAAHRPGFVLHDPELAATASRASDAAAAGRMYVDARRDLRRAFRGVQATVVDGEAILQARIEFRTATADLFADPRAFHRAFAALPTTAKRSLLADMAERPESVAERIGPGGRLATARTADPRWDALAAVRADGLRDAASAASQAGSAYIARLTDSMRTLRGALREGRSRAHEATLARIGKHFPEAAMVDKHARLSAEIDRVEAEITTRRSDAAQFDRTYDVLKAHATEFRSQLATIVTDPETFLTRFRGLTVAEKHRVLDRMAERPQDLVDMAALGSSAKLQKGAAGYTRLVARHGRHYVENTVRYRERLEAAATRLGLDPTASRGDIRSHLEAEVTTLTGRAEALRAERSTLLNTPHDERVGEWLRSQRVGGRDAALELAHALRSPDAGEIVPRWLAAHGIAQKTFDAARAGIESASPATFERTVIGRAAGQWKALGDAERAHATLAYPHLARLIARVEDARDIGLSQIGRQRKTTALKEHSGIHRPRNKEVAGIEL